jgi:CheY-like chemotaxis protein
MRILIAEDEESDFELIEVALRRSAADLTVDWVRDGAEARQYLAAEGRFSDRPLPDLLITDLKMPHVDGFELIESVKTSPRLRHLPVVVMSSSSQPVDIARAYATGANAYFLKPTNFDGLMALCAHITAYWNDALHPVLG